MAGGDGFFQLCLLAGYILAHLASRWSPQRHVFIWLGLMAAAAFFLPPHITAEINSASSSIAFQVFKALAMGVGMPFVVLSMTSSTLQRLYATTPEGARSPYVLFAASNFGSFLGLLAYPLILEPWIGLADQRLIWSCAYILVGAGGLLSLLLAGRHEEAKPPCCMPVTGRQRLMWVLYAAVPSSLSMGFTERVTTDIASAPLLWALPLAVYLLTFVEAFATRPRFNAAKIDQAFLSLGAIEIALELFGDYLTKLPMFAFVFLAFSFGALALHKRLAAIKPEAGLLTEYYVFIALGGALGGCFNAFLAPLIFVRPVEFALAVMAGMLLLKQPSQARTKRKEAHFEFVALALFAVLLAAQHGILKTGFAPLGFVVLFLLTVALFFAVRPLFLTPLLAILLIADCAPQLTHIMGRSRNFFGSLTVVGNEDGSMRRLRHGTTLHGVQFLSPALSRDGAVYYGPLSPVRDVFGAAPLGATIVLVGLGAGTMACLAPKGSKTSFIEIDPQVAVFAKKYFSFLEQCPPERIDIGDGRLGIEKLPDGRVDLLVIDAFSSDSIPTHLLTVEAMKIYARKLKPDGMLTLHLSNRYLSLAPVAAAALKEAGMASKIRIQSRFDDFNVPSSWLAAAQNAGRLAALSRLNADWEAPPEACTPWTDDHNDIFSAFRIIGFLKKSLRLE